jgi:hypothetical protein
MFEMSAPSKSRKAQPKRHHFIPALHLRHFAGAEPKGQVWTYDAEAARVYSAIPEETAKQSHFYSFEHTDGTKDGRIEDYLAEIEGRAAPVYEALLRCEIPGKSQARVDFSSFLALMYARTPSMRRMAGELHGRGIQIHSYAYAQHDEAFDGLIRRMEREHGPMDSQTRATLRENMLDPSRMQLEIPKEYTFQALTIADELAPMLFGMHWAIMLPEYGYFITSDNPLVRWVPPNTRHPIYGDHGFRNKLVEVTFPLSPKMMLLMTWKDTGREIAALPRQGVIGANEMRAANSDRYLYAHLSDKRLERLAERFKDSRPGMTTQGFGPKKFGPIRVVRSRRGQS